jgi:hypothetical protein
VRRAAAIELLALALLVSAATASAQINMPDPSLIAGKAIPATDLATGTITVRVVREAIGNNVVGQEVRVTIGDSVKTSRTDAQGRAEFTGLTPGAQGRAEAVVGTEKLASDPFAVPTSGGLRVILVADLAKAAERRKQDEAAAAAAPPVRGAVVLGGETRVVMEFQDDVLRVFYVLNIMNNARTRVDIGGPFLLDLPRGASGASKLDGSAPSATVLGNRLTVTGPFAAGPTNVTVGFELRYDSSHLTFDQKFPAAMEQLTVAVEKVGDLAVSSPQFSTTGDIRSEDGSTFILASGPGLQAGSPLTLQLSNLPIHSRMPRWIALGIAVALLLAGAWLAIRVKAPGEMARSRLVERRDTLLAELVRIEKRRRTGAGDMTKDAAAQRRLMGELERVYGELDESGGGPRGGGEGIAA